MNTLSCKRLTAALAVGVIGLAILFGCLYWNHSWLRIQLAWADKQTMIFEEMRIQALQGDAAKASGALEYVLTYYPSGSKQETGSSLDRMVERERAVAIRDIIAYLRLKTGEDLGNQPDAWIQKYANR